MIEENSKKILQKLSERNLVLDIGGWSFPYNRADYVIDIHPYETRGFFGCQGGREEHFTKDTWIIHDISSRKKLPFKNNQFDFVICSHVLEDVRDPIWLCSEIRRVGKRGYIEVPSKRVELTKGVANSRYAGYYHHRWLAEIKNSKIVFKFKPHFIHNNWKFHFPKKSLSRLKDDEKVSFLFWEQTFDFYEEIQISKDKIEQDIFNFIKDQKTYPKVYYSLDSFKNKLNFFYVYWKKKFKPDTYHHKYMDTEIHKSR